jgi:hypothetical protein
MTGNPLVAVGAPPEPTAPQTPPQVVHLVCNAPPNKVEGLGEFLTVFNRDEARAEVTQFRHVIQRKARRSMGGKFGRGLTTEVTENIEVNLNQDLIGLRRWLGAVRQNPSNVLLLQVGKIRDEPLAAPLIFSEMLRTGRPILVTGVDNLARDQLLSPIDLKFQQIPAPVTRNYPLKTALLARVQRPKGFASAMRGLMELDCLPKPVADKVAQIATGGDLSGLSEAETINLALLADLVSRYEASLNQFKEFIKGGTLQVPQLTSIFEVITADLNLEQAQETFKPFLLEEGAQIGSKSHLFGHIYRFLIGTGDETRKSQDRMGQFLRVLNNTFMRRRAQIDPLLWKRCSFLGAPHPAEEALLKTLQPYLTSLEKWIGSADGALEEAREHTGRCIFELATLANRDPGQMREDAEFAKHRLANQLLPLLRTKAFDTERLLYGNEPGELLPKEMSAFLTAFQALPLTQGDLEQIRANLAPVLRANEATSNALHKGVIDVIVRHSRQRVQTLKEIYILNAIGTLVKYPFHLGPHALNPIERRYALEVMPSRLGLEFHPHAVSEFSVPLFAQENEPGLGKLQNDPVTLCRAYARLMGLRVEDVVKRAVDHKINYLIKTFGENFFEVIFERVVRRNDIPLSQAQLARILKQRNVLGSLDEKGLRATALDELEDPFLAVGMRRVESRKHGEIPAAHADFEAEYQDSLNQFRALLADLKVSAENDPREENPKRLIWALYRQGICNLAREEARGLFRKSPYYRSLQELIARISSENYSLFHREGTSEGVKIFVPRRHSHFLTIGERYTFLDANQVVRYQFLPSPVEALDKLDEQSRVFMENLLSRFSAAEKEPWVLNLEACLAEIQRCTAIWSRFSRNLALPVLDRVLSETVIKELQPDRYEPKHLYYLPDSVKLCLGRATVGEESVPFTKILQRPELIGNIAKNPNTSSSTIDDFAIEVHKIGRVWEELRTYAGLCEDVLDIIQSLSHERSEMAAALNYEKELRQMLLVLNKPVRDIGEQDVQALHTHAKAIKEVLQVLYNSQSASKRKITTRLQAQLEARRSDRDLSKLNFTDAFLLPKTQVTVRQVVQKGDERVAVQRKKEVELDATHQTLPLRIREVIRIQEFLQRKKYIVFAPEGQKKKQIDYVLEAIDTVLTLRGNAVHVYVDTSMLEEGQVNQLATRVKPSNFFDMNDIKPEAPPGMKVDFTTDPLTGRAMKSEARPAGPEAAPAPPSDPNAPVMLRCAKDPSVAYKYDPAMQAYYFQGPEGEIRSSALPVALGKGVPTLILMTRLPGGRPVFHGLLGNEVLLPTLLNPTLRKFCTFQFFDQAVSLVNEGGKPTVQIEREASDFVNELRGLN